MNQGVAQIADTVVLMVAGLPVAVKESKMTQHAGDANVRGSAQRNDERARR